VLQALICAHFRDMQLSVLECSTRAHLTLVVARGATFAGAVDDGGGAEAVEGSGGGASAVL
jgi:hypothetical protein